MTGGKLGSRSKLFASLAEQNNFAGLGKAVEPNKILAAIVESFAGDEDHLRGVIADLIEV